MVNSTQYLGYQNGATKYYVNARGQNYLPHMENEWARSGYLPRIAGIFQTSDSFAGTNKTSQWWYYDSEDNERCLMQLRSLGQNCIRVFPDIYVWHRDPEHFLSSIVDFHRLCDKHKIRVQWCIWDGIEILNGGPSAPINRSETTSSLEHGLLCSWHAVPHDFEVSSIAASQNFFTTCATPYLNQFVSSVSSFQSLWSFDLKNESNGIGRVALLSSTSVYLSSLLSSINIGLTFGHGSTYNIVPSNAVLSNGLGQGPGGTYSVLDYITSCSPWLNFASIHTYADNRYNFIRYLNEAVSGAQILNLPGMINEHTVYRYELDTLKEFRYGIMPFDGCIDRAFTNEPFDNIQGIFYADGQVRNRDTALAYVEYASSTGWFSNSQLLLDPIEKTVSVNNGLDGGFYSGTVPEHQEFRSSYSSTNEAAWNIAKTLVYTNFPYASKNFPPIAGHPMDKQVFYTLIGENLQFRDQVRMILDWENQFEPLSSISDSNFNAKNKEVCIRTLILNEVPRFLFDFAIYGQLVGSQFDPNPIPSSMRYDFSATASALFRTAAASSIAPLVNNRFATQLSSIDCHATSSCYYNVPGDISQGIDWEAYDSLYNSCFNKLRDCIEIMLDYGEDNNLYQFKLLD